MVIAFWFLIVLLVIDKLPWNWFPPLTVFGSRIYTLWLEVDLSFTSIMLAELESVARLLAFPILALIKLIAWLFYWGSWLLVAWVAATMFSVGAPCFTAKVFRSVIALLMLLSGLAILCTT